MDFCFEFLLFKDSNKMAGGYYLHGGKDCHVARVKSVSFQYSYHPLSLAAFTA